MDIFLGIVLIIISIWAIICCLSLFAHITATITNHIKNARHKYYYVAYHNIVDPSSAILSGPYENISESITHVTSKPYISEFIQYELRTTDLQKAREKIESGSENARIMQINRPPNIKN